MSTLFTAAEQGFRGALEAHPNDHNAARAFVDWMMEFQGMSGWAARREVVRIRREYAEDQQFRRVYERLAGDMAIAQRVRANIEYRFASTIREDWELRITKGGGSPYLSEVPSFWRNVTARGPYTQRETPEDQMGWEFCPAEHFVNCPAAWLARMIERIESTVLVS